MQVTSEKYEPLEIQGLSLGYESNGFESRDSVQSRFYARIGKRFVDIVIACLALLVLGPLILVIAACVACDGHLPFFAHKRIGQNGRAFGCLKIRSMVPNAEQKLQAILDADQTARAEWDEGCKLTNDPRVTPIGRFLRRTSLDELPQIWNVLTGEMSIVGPRPITTEELKRYGDNVGSYFAMRPGLTGLWQVEGRNDVSYEVRVQIDARYARIVSLKEDIRIILLTALSVAKLTGR